MKQLAAAVLNPLILRIEEIESERKVLWHRRTVGIIGAEEFKAQREALDAEFLALKLKVSGVTLKLKEPEPAATPLAEAVAGTPKGVLIFCRSDSPLAALPCNALFGRCCQHQPNCALQGNAANGEPAKN